MASLSSDVATSGQLVFFGALIGQLGNDVIMPIILAQPECAGNARLIVFVIADLACLFCNKNLPAHSFSQV